MKERRKLRGVRYIPRSGNSKIGGQKSNALDAIYIAIGPSCLDCPFKSIPSKDGDAGQKPVKQGCWAEVERVGMLNMRLEQEAMEDGMDRRALGREVARAIRASWPRGIPKGQRLRLPVSGDLSTPSAIKPVAAAVDDWLDRGGAGVWGYTHGWRRVRREAWGTVSVLASVETIADAKKAIKRGYAPAIVVADFPNGPRAWFEDELRIIPCPEQTLGVTCDECQLCFNDTALLDRNAVVAFKAHGQTKKRALKVLQEKASCP